MEEVNILKETVDGKLKERKKKVGFISTSKMVENIMIEYK
jgi:hypothetical protein